MGLFGLFKKADKKEAVEVDTGNFDEQYQTFKDAYVRYEKAARHKDENPVEVSALADEVIISAEGINERKLAMRIMKESEKNRGYLYHSDFGIFDSNGSDIKLSKILDNVKQTQKHCEFVARRMDQIDEAISQIPVYEVTVETGKELKRNTVSDMPEIKVSGIGKAFNRSAKIPVYVVIDVETTGLKASSDRIIELSAIRYEGKDALESFTTRINPKKAIPKEASKINGITDEDVKDAPLLGEVADSFLSFVGKSPIVGYNIGFDLKFLYASGIDLITKRKIYDAYELGQKYWKNDEVVDHRLTTIAEKYLVYYNAHNSLTDCYVTSLVFNEMLDDYLN